MNQVRHPNIVEIRDHSFATWSCTIYFEYCEYGDMKSKILEKIEKREKFEEEVVWKVIL